MSAPTLTRISLAALVAATGVAMAAAPATAHPKPPKTVLVRLVSINDFHGNLEPPTGSGGAIVNESGVSVPAGGAAYLATHLKSLAGQNENGTVVVGAGDLIGATPLISAAYHDEPTVELLGNLGLEVSSVGNHEFDEGIDELRRVQDGGCHPVDGCSPAGRWRGASYEYLAANVLKEKNDRYALPPVAVKKVGGVKVGFIGLVTRTTPTIVTASGIAGLKFAEEVESGNRAASLLRRAGVKAIVALVHEGDQITPNQSPDACPVTPGAGSRIAQGLSADVDLVIMGHSHQAYICKTKDPAGQDRYYTQGSSFGRVLTTVDFQVDKKTGEVVRSSVTPDNHVVTRDVTPDATTAAFVQTWKDRVATVANKPIGKITADLGRAGGQTGETPLGDVIADAQLEATKTGGGAEIALMNPGGVRADLTYAQSGSEGDGVVTYGEAFTVQPFNNLMQVVTLTGARLDALLEQQWQNGGAITRILQPSASLTYTMNLSQPIGSRVSDIKINGTPVTDTQEIRVAANNFLVGGGDGFSVFKEGTNLWSGPLDIDALVAYLGAHSPVAPPATARITLAG
ncbi:bifunctional metallophosphatase/5'-nucleotidase [Sphaerisporangium siamense]|uniref:5'-nucleotidase n=1 Tax=Sphaerisporangium siamense TaxID=795645 RepID=A0A7W7G7K9_9ACTN|nr:bifunctional metallophosphatase/5'-nucleotidase [Sphaerisporangium siamense]MBB4698634.1 5'-nucleotidase [Sphaerisporangium siamense]GII85307.1 bifunctional metallophosphatase/5'-nucleotidase [Sphaerisporangium siamense]